MIRYKFIKEKNFFIKLDLAFQLLRSNLEAPKIDIENINIIIRSIDVLIRNIIKKHKFSSKKVKILFFELLLNDLQSILVLLEKNWLSRQYKKIKVFEKDTRKSIYLYLKKYDKYLVYLIYKLFSNYGTSILYLSISTLIICFWFWFLFYISDHIRTQYYVWEGKLQSIWYYFYVSLSTFSNLWWDLSMAWNNFLIFLFLAEQVLWVIVFWLLIYQFNNDLK